MMDLTFKNKFGPHFFPLPIVFNVRFANLMICGSGVYLINHTPNSPTKKNWTPWVANFLSPPHILINFRFSSIASSVKSDIGKFKSCKLTNL